MNSGVKFRAADSEFPALLSLERFDQYNIISSKTKRKYL